MAKDSKDLLLGERSMVWNAHPELYRITRAFKGNGDCRGFVPVPSELNILPGDYLL